MHFRILQSLKFFFLGYNNVSEVILQQTFYSLQHNFRYLSLSHNKMGVNITGEFIKGLTGLKLTDLFIEGNNIKTLDFTVFRELKVLQRLSAKGNDIYKIRDAVPKGITHLFLQWNRLSILPQFCSGSSHSNLVKIDLSGNNIGHLSRQSLVCLINLKYFGLGGNRLITLTPGTFSLLPQIDILSLNGVFKERGYAETVRIEPYAFNNSVVKVLYLASIARFGYFKLIVNPNAFKGCTGLTRLILSYNVMIYFNDTYLNVLLGDLHTLQVIKMSRCQLSFFPEVLSTLVELRTIDLHGNRIMRLKQGLFNNLKKLQHISLSENAIEVIHEANFPVNLRNQLKYINLAVNNYVCTCANLWFITWIKSDKNIFDYFPDNYVCGYPTELQSKRLIDANISEQTCQISPYMFPIIFGLSIAAIVLLVIISLTYRWRWHIRYCVYMLRFRQRQRNVEREEAFIYDAFVLYCEDDSWWIRNNLLPKIETDGNLKLCIHERDFTPGFYIVDNIVKSLENSRNIVLVLSDNFSQSPWCLFELTLVLKRSLEQDDGYVMVVLLEEIHAQNMTSSLYALLQTTTYITWPVEEEDRELFWMRLRHCLQR
ncbi:toll-like receptor 2 [Haliotis rubra]|uniref:toll-like receptor 2 n=1 Tax=Haliotis rubra TaxID=36100 RepID=UPI001EE55370|nr:toll-like receptor 2 [Haliotis rubra]XP_046551883.1 toll-like receptor 2 [Haliotis rubra]